MTTSRWRGGRVIFSSASITAVFFLLPLLHVCLLDIPVLVLAGIASPHSFVEYQPDNTTIISLNVRGDEDYSYYVDADGFAVVRDEDGWLVYFDDASLRVGHGSPTKRGLRRGLAPSGDLKEDDNRRYLTNRYLTNIVNSLSSSNNNIRTKGKFTNLVLLLRFQNSPLGKDDLPTREQIGILMNSPSPHEKYAPTGSVQSAYREYSYGQTTIHSFITPWIRVGRTEKESSTRQGFKKTLAGALTILKRKTKIDARNYDSVTILHNAYGAEHGSTDCYGTPSEDRVWAHSGSLHWMGRTVRYGVTSALWGYCGKEIARIGMIAHELGHTCLRLPDLYDKNGRGSGIGAFDLMAYAWGKDHSQYYPPHPSAWTKLKLKWINPTRIKKAGQYIMYPSQTNPMIYRIDEGYPQDEYLLIEYRGDLGFDNLGCAGAIIYKIDDRAPRQSRPGFPLLRDRRRNPWPRNGDHYQVAVLQHDRLYELEKGSNVGNCGDLWGWEGSDVANDMLGPGGNIFAPLYPNTDSYQGGNIQSTGLKLYDFKKNGRRLKFSVSGPHLTKEDRPTTRSDDERGANSVGPRGNNKGRKNCRDDANYKYVSSSGIRYTCADAKGNEHICRRKDEKTKRFFWQYCKATCRKLFLSSKYNAEDICPN